jgi:(2Fe-2S) ferredoxin
VTRYVVICRGPNCRERGALPLRKRLVQLLKDDPETHLLGYACFGQCEHGPNVAFYPEGTWYGDLKEADAAERVVRDEIDDAHALCVPEPERSEHLRNIAELVTTLERDRARRQSRRWWWPF